MASLTDERLKEMEEEMNRYVHCVSKNKTLDFLS